MTKVNIIEIDLGDTIDKIISENIQELTGTAKRELNNAIELAQSRDSLREKKSTEKRQKTDVLSKVMSQAYDKLVAAGDAGVLYDDIVNIVGKHVINLTAFTIRMKKILRDKGNPYSISRKNKNGKCYYIFSSFNQRDIK